MAHNLDTTNGQTAFVSARKDAWHHLGVTLPDAFTAEDAMEHGLLGGWNVRTQPLFAHVKSEDETDDSPASQIEIPNRYAVVRNNPVIVGHARVLTSFDPLGVVGSAYHPIQNEAHAEFLNTLVDESGAHFETAGAIDGGRKVFITMKMPGHMKVGGVDQVDMYLAALNSHDGSLPFTIMVTPVRVVREHAEPGVERHRLEGQDPAHPARRRVDRGARSEDPGAVLRLPGRLPGGGGEAHQHHDDPVAVRAAHRAGVRRG